MKTALRLPRDLHAQLLDAAQASGRSLNSELIERLRESIGGGNVTLPDAIREELYKRARANGWPFESEFLHTLVDALQHNISDDVRDLQFQLERMGADRDMERALAERFRAAADISDDLRVLAAAMLLRVVSGADAIGGFEIDDTLLSMMGRWLAERDLRGAVFSIARLLDRPPPEIVETLQNMAGFLEDADLVRPMPIGSFRGDFGRDEVRHSLADDSRNWKKPPPPVEPKQSSTMGDFESPAPQITIEMRPAGNLNLKGDPEHIKAVLRAGGITNFVPTRGGIQVAVSQAQAAAKLIEGSALGGHGFEVAGDPPEPTTKRLTRTPRK